MAALWANYSVATKVANLDNEREPLKVARLAVEKDANSADLMVEMTAAWWAAWSDNYSVVRWVGH